MTSKDRTAHDADRLATAATVIEPSKGWRDLGLGDLWEYRELLYFMLWRDVKGRYRQMALGPTWIILQPLISMVVLSFVFGKIAKLPSEGQPYALFTYVALLPWQFFATGTRLGSQSLLSQKHVISKVYFPRLILPVAGLGGAFVDLLASLVVLAGMVLYYRVAITWHVLWLPVYVLVAACTALAVGLWLACLAIKFRDVIIGLGFMLTAWQYLTPVAYSADLVPDKYQWIYQLNPMAHVVQGFRWALLGTGAAPGRDLGIISLAVILLALAGGLFFRRTERTIVDLI